jgi:hypothetical protein
MNELSRADLEQADYALSFPTFANHLKMTVIHGG